MRSQAIVPNFFIVGAPKAGTTSLYKCLEAHPEIYMPTLKEPNYFSGSYIQGQGLYYREDKPVLDLREYLRLFELGVGYKRVGEASVSYLYYPEVAKKIYAFNPEAKIIILLRNPVDRAHSHYWMDYRFGYRDYDFPEILERGKNAEDKLALYYQQIFGLGFYSEQVKRYLDVFGRDRVKIILFEDMIKERVANTLQGVYHFLEVDKGFNQEIGVHNAFVAPRYKWIDLIYRNPSIRKMARSVISHGWRDKVARVVMVKSQKPALAPDLKRLMMKLYAEDVHRLSVMIDRDLGRWVN